MLTLRPRLAHLALALLATLIVFAAGAGTAAAAAELVMFDSPGCPYCVRWHRDVGPGYPKSAEGQRAPLRIHPIERQSQSGVALASPVRASPTFVLVDDGREVGRIVGYPGADFFWGLLDELIAKLDARPAPNPTPRPQPIVLRR